MTQSIGTNLSFCGRPPTTDELSLIQGISKDFAALGRTEIANTICELLQMIRPTGKLKTVECRLLLETLEASGFLILPPRCSQRIGPRKTSPTTPIGEFGAPMLGYSRIFDHFS